LPGFYHHNIDHVQVPEYPRSSTWPQLWSQNRCLVFHADSGPPISAPMFADFLKRLTQPNPPQLIDTDARLALTAMLVRVARSDGSYDASELDRIERIIAARYGLSSADAIELRVSAEILEAEAPDTVRFTRAIKDAVPYEDRQSVVAALWEVVLADGVREHHEDALLRLVANLLGVNDRDSNMARQHIEKQMK